MALQKILVAQGGGPTAVINQSLVGVVREARKFAGRRGLWRGGMACRHRQRGFRRPGRESDGQSGAVAATPSAALGSTRDKPDLKYCQAIFRSPEGARNRPASTISAAMISPTPCASSARRRARSAIPCAACIFPRPSTTIWWQRPYAGLSLGRPLRHAGVHGRQSRQRLAAGRLLRGHDGPPRRLSHRRLGAGARHFPAMGRT